MSASSTQFTLLAHNPRRQRIQRIARSASGAEAIREAAKVKLVDRVHHLYHGTLKDFILQRRDAAIPDSGPGTAKVQKGGMIGSAGRAADDFIVSYFMLPADYDESRGISKVVEAVQEKHDDLMVPEVALVAPEMFRAGQRARLAMGGTASPFDPHERSSPARDMAVVNLLTVFMTADGKIAREVIEPKRAAELQSVFPLPVGDDTIAMYTPPYNSFNPPPVPPEAFRVLGLDAAQIGTTGYVIVHRKSSAGGARILPAPGVVVRYAWPRQ